MLFFWFNQFGFILFHLNFFLFCFDVILDLVLILFSRFDFDCDFDMILVLVWF